VAGHLARAGRDVLLLARGDHLAAIRARGLRVETPTGPFTVQLAVADPGAPIAWRDDDLLVVAVKTQDLGAALRAVAPPPRIPIACMTNGVEAERIALRHAREVYGVCNMMSASYLVPGTVQVWGAPVPGLLDLGRYPDGTGASGDALAGELIVAGFESEVRTNIMKWKRGKLLANLANAVEAISGPAARRSELAGRAKAEGRACYAVANLSCITEGEDTARRGDYKEVEIAGHRRVGDSTYQSLAKGRDLETDYLNGEIAMLGRLHGVATPVNEALQAIAAEAARTGAHPGTLPLAELEAKIAALGA
jgi:2-dehydropantoate 2-reductase